MSELLTPQDAAAILGVGPQRVRQLEREGRLSATRTPAGWRLFRREDVERLAAERAQARAARPFIDDDAA